jgi:hypothetical protein
VHALEARIRHWDGCWEEERAKGLPPWGALNQQVINGDMKDVL